MMVKKLYKCPGIEHTIELGMGFNWFDHLGSGGHYARWENYPLSEKVYPDLENEEAWLEIEKGLNELGLNWIRFGLPPNPHVSETGEFIGNTIHIERLIWLNGWAEKFKKTILIDPFLMPEYYEFPTPEGTQNPGPSIVNMAAIDNRSYAQHFVKPLFNLLINELGLDSVRYFNPINEPMEYGVFQTPEGSTPEIIHYVEMYREIRMALDEIGIDRNRVGLIGLDGSFPEQILRQQLIHKVDMNDLIDAYSVHHYDLKLDYLPTKYFPEKPAGYFTGGTRVAIEYRDAELLAYCRERGKTLWALEMGTFYYGKFEKPEGVATLEACFTVSEAIIRALNVGITTFCIWSLMNPNTVDGHWAVIGLEDDKLHKFTYPFAFYSLLSRHIISGGTAYPLDYPWDSELRSIYGTLIQSEKELTILLSNNHPTTSETIEISLPDGMGVSDKFVVTKSSENTLAEETEIIVAENGVINIEVPSLTLLGLRRLSTL
jgi:hypothetical protein